MKNYKTIIAVVAAGLGCSIATSQATLTGIAAPGGTVTPVPLTSQADLVGLLADTGPIGYSFGGGNDTGTVETRVYATDTDTGALSGYAFEYIITVTKGDISQINPNGFAGLASVAVGSIAGVIPADGIGWAAANGVVNANFGLSGTSALTTTSTFVVDTAVTSFGLNTAGLQDNAPDGGVSIYAPVPEPTTIVAGALMLLPLGIGAVRSLRKDRNA